MRRWFSLLFCIVLVLTLPITALAHPGRTDSSGGHTDRSTGEYHYHHGQPAHDHYDADGDGNVDCPYDFDDATSSNSSSDRKAATASIPDIKSNDSDASRLNKASFFDWASALATSFFPSMLLSFFIIHLLSFPAQILLPKHILENCIWLVFWVIFIFVYIKVVGRMLV